MLVLNAGNYIVGKKLKLIERFKTKPVYFSWQELNILLAFFGFERVSAGKTGGSRVKFVRASYPVIFLHTPHPGRILKRYQVNYIYDFLVNEGLL